MRLTEKQKKILKQTVDNQVQANHDWLKSTSCRRPNERNAWYEYTIDETRELEEISKQIEKETK